MKKNRLSEPLLQYLRASLIDSYRKQHGVASNNYLKNLLVSVPVNVEFEKHIIKTGITTVNTLLETRYATSLQHDLELLD